MNEKTYKVFSNAIEKIINNDFPPEAKGFHMEFTQTSKPNSEAIINFIRKNNIPYKIAAAAVDLSSHQLKVRLAENRRSDIPQEFKDELISKLKSHLQLINHIVQ
ncbi:MAG: hypothetical protein U5K00_02180 [Melioribacteraceae bacterium]|nr:hypothetical protein [Melioribacteraceae bacterium]